VITHLLDTNACIRHLNGRAPQLSVRLKDFDPSQLAVCSIVKGELFFGSLRSQNPARSRQIQDNFLKDIVSLTFDDAVAEHYAEIRADLANKGTPIGPNDLIIAATALAHNLILVSHNVAEFSRVNGLRVEDWELPVQP
jgi:tRNA(fMet)-specific endonuclease VapC